MATFRLGLIGAGRRGRLAKLAHRPEAGVELAAVCDPRAGVVEAYRRELGERVVGTGDWREVVADPRLDAVFITTPDHLHEEQAAAALEVGKAVYLEKPMAITIEGCDRVLAAAERHGGRLYVGHNMRFFPVIRKMKELIDAGTIGEVQAVWCRHFIDYGGDAYFKDWHSERRYTTGLLLQKGAHDIDLIHWLAGGYTTRVTAMGKLSVYNRVTDRRGAGDAGSAAFEEANWPPLSQKGLSPVIDVEDHNMVLMQLANGVQASYTQCHYSPDGWRNYTILGAEGRIENDGDHSSEDYAASVRVWTKRCGPRLHEHQRIEIPAMEGTHGGADRLIVDDFLRFLTTGDGGSASPLDARMAVAAGVMATHSLRHGNRPMDVSPPAPPVAPEPDHTMETRP